MRKVSKDEFFAAMGELDVAPRVIRTRPTIVSEWHLQSGGDTRRVIGRSVSDGNFGHEYFLSDTK